LNKQQKSDDEDKPIHTSDDSPPITKEKLEEISAMEPSCAAKILNKLTPLRIRTIIEKMPPDKFAPIFAQMEMDREKMLRIIGQHRLIISLIVSIFREMKEQNLQSASPILMTQESLQNYSGEIDSLVIVSILVMDISDITHLLDGWTQNHSSNIVHFFDECHGERTLSARVHEIFGTILTEPIVYIIAMNADISAAIDLIESVERDKLVEPFSRMDPQRVIDVINQNVIDIKTIVFIVNEVKKQNPQSASSILMTKENLRDYSGEINGLVLASIFAMDTSDIVQLLGEWAQNHSANIVHFFKRYMWHGAIYLRESFEASPMDQQVAIINILATDKDYNSPIPFLLDSVETDKLTEFYGRLNQESKTFIKTRCGSLFVELGLL
jgi:hypothetical protein